jgi:hypothetical protein
VEDMVGTPPAPGGGTPSKTADGVTVRV